MAADVHSRADCGKARRSVATCLAARVSSGVSAPSGPMMLYASRLHMSRLVGP